MAEGYEKRANPVDNLRGSEAIQPVTRSVTGVAAPRAPQVVTDTFGQQVAASLGKFASGKLLQAQQKKQERSVTDGQLAAMQGESFESVEMEGDKWALEGYRAVTASTISAGMLRAQEQDINSGGYEQDPEAYRQRLTDRITGVTEGIEDERTRELVRQQFIEQAPKLIDSHMQQNLAFKEEQNFNALAASVDVLSRDNSSTGALMSFAMGGEGAATAGLSQERRKAAVTQGIVDSFQKDNPAAYAHLEQAGFLSPENLTTSQLRQIESAKSAFHSRMEGEWNEEWHVAVEQMAANNAKHNRRTTAASAGNIYNAARAGVQFNEGTRGLNIQAAGEAGDYATQAALMQAAVIHQESRGRSDAVSPVGATGIMQVMPATAMTPNFKKMDGTRSNMRNVFEIARDMGVRFNGRTESEARRLLFIEDVNKEMGMEYLQGLLREFDGNVELSLAAYNAGPHAVQKYGGIPPYRETQDYVTKITKSWSDDRPDPAADRIAAETRLAAVRKQAALDSYEAATPYLDQLDQQFKRGTLSHDDWIAQSREVMGKWGMAVDMQRLNHEAQINRSVLSNVSNKVEAEAATQSEIALAADLRVWEQSFDTVVEQVANGTGSPEELNQAVTGMAQVRANLHEKYGIPVASQTEIAAQDSDVKRAIEAVQVGRVAAQQRTVRERAAAMGTADALPAAEQAKLVKEHDDRLRQKYTDAVQSGEMSPERAQAAFMTEQVQHLARTGIVEPTQKRIINSSLNQAPMVDGKPNPAFQEAMQSYMTMRAVNPSLADRYVDVGNRAVVDTIAARLGTNGNLPAAIQGYAANLEQATGSTPWATPEEFRNDPSVIRGVGKAVSQFIGRTDIGATQATMTKDAEWLQVWDRRPSDSAALNEQRDVLEQRLMDEVLEVQSYAPNLKTEDIIAMASERVSREVAFVGGDMISFGNDVDVYEAFYGNMAQEMRGRADAVNSSVMNYVRSDAFRERYPFAENSSFGETTGLSVLGRGISNNVLEPVANIFLPQSLEFDTSSGGTSMGPRGALATGLSGARPFKAFPVPDGAGGARLALQFAMPSGGYSEPIHLDPSEVGAYHLQQLQRRDTGSATSKPMSSIRQTQ